METNKTKHTDQSFSEDPLLPGNRQPPLNAFPTENNQQVFYKHQERIDSNQFYGNYPSSEQLYYGYQQQNSYMAAPPHQIYNEDYIACPRCNGKMLPHIVAEKRTRNILTILLYLVLLFVPIIGWIALALLIKGKKSKTITYLICQRCGNSINSKRIKRYI